MPEGTYDRAWSVTAFQTGPTKSFNGPHPEFANPAYNVLEIDALQVRFKIEKNLAKDPNTCELEIVNCSAPTRSSLCSKPLGIRIAAGHESSGGPRHLFTGALRFGQSVIEGTEWTTKLELGDGAAAFDLARINKSYGPQTPVVVALRDVAASMGMALPAEVEADPELQRGLAGGLAALGSSQQVMSRLLARHGYSWSVQDGRLTVLRDGRAAPGTALEVSTETGLLGYPQWASAEAGKPRRLKFTHLLYPQVTPGLLLRVLCRDIDGIFVAQRVTHNGDTHSVDEWTTEVDCVPSQNAVIR